MSTVARSVFTFVLFIFLCHTLPAHADLRLNFGTPVSQRIQISIRNILQHSNYDIAAYDLDGDGLHEYFVKTNFCLESYTFCPFFVFKDTRYGLRQILQIQARAVGISSDYTHGFQNILVFRDLQNDYNFEVYIWDQGQSRYILSE